MSFFASCKRSYGQRAWAQWFQLDMQAHAYVNTFSTLDARVNPCLPGEKRLFFCCQIFLCFDFQLNFYDIKKKKKGQNPEHLSALPTLKAWGSSRAGRQDTSVAGRGFFPALGQQTAQSYGNYWRLTVPEGLHPSIPVERATNWIPERRVLVETGMAFPMWLMVSARKLVFNSFHGSFPYSLSG